MRRNTDNDTAAGNGEPQRQRTRSPSPPRARRPADAGMTMGFPPALFHRQAVAIFFKCIKCQQILNDAVKVDDDLCCRACYPSSAVLPAKSFPAFTTGLNKEKVRCLHSAYVVAAAAAPSGHIDDGETAPRPATSGCEWTGKLSELRPHLMNECGFSQVSAKIRVQYIALIFSAYTG